MGKKNLICSFKESDGPPVVHRHVNKKLGFLVNLWITNGEATIEQTVQVSKKMLITDLCKVIEKDVQDLSLTFELEFGASTDKGFEIYKANPKKKVV